MFKLYFALILIVLLAQQGLNVTESLFCHNRSCTAKLEKASRDVLEIDWKPISVFPEEAQRFR